jgi:hypothetical protein
MAPATKMENTEIQATTIPSTMDNQEKYHDMTQSMEKKRHSPIRWVLVNPKSSTTPNSTSTTTLNTTNATPNTVPDTRLSAEPTKSLPKFREDIWYNLSWEEDNQAHTLQMKFRAWPATMTEQDSSTEPKTSGNNLRSLKANAHLFVVRSTMAEEKNDDDDDDEEEHRVHSEKQKKRKSHSNEFDSADDDQEVAVPAKKQKREANTNGPDSNNGAVVKAISQEPTNDDDDGMAEYSDQTVNLIGELDEFGYLDWW